MQWAAPKQQVTGQGRFRLAVGKNFVTEKVVKHWKALPREEVSSPSLEASREGLERAPSALGWLTSWGSLTGWARCSQRAFPALPVPRFPSAEARCPQAPAAPPPVRNYSSRPAPLAGPPGDAGRRSCSRLLKVPHGIGEGPCRSSPAWPSAVPARDGCAGGRGARRPRGKGSRCAGEGAAAGRGRRAARGKAGAVPSGTARDGPPEAGQGSRVFPLPSRASPPPSPGGVGRCRGSARAGGGCGEAAGLGGCGSRPCSPVRPLPGSAVGSRWGRGCFVTLRLCPSRQGWSLPCPSPPAGAHPHLPQL